MVSQTVKNTVGFKLANIKLPYLLEDENYLMDSKKAVVWL